jgi:hypothetical protein
MNTTYIIIAALVAVFLVVLTIYLMGFKNWLVWAVSEAEKVLGSGTGQLKLRLVYDMAVARFPIVAKLIPFKLFSNMVDAALKIMNEMIKNNASIAEAITNQIEGEDDGI